MVPGRLHHRELPGPVPQLVLLDAGDEPPCSRTRAPFKTVLGYATLLRRGRRGDAQEQGQHHPLRRGRRAASAPTRCAGSTSTTRRSRTCASRASPREEEAAGARGQGPAAAPQRPVDAGARAARQALERLLVLRDLRQYRPASTRRRARCAVGKRSDLDRWVLSELQETVQRATERLDDFDAAAACAGAGGVHRESLELVRAPQPPPLLEERGGHRQGRRLPDALRVPGDGDEAAGAAHAVPGGVAVPESRALGGCQRARERASLRLAGGRRGAGRATRCTTRRRW